MKKFTFLLVLFLIQFFICCSKEENADLDTSENYFEDKCATPEIGTCCGTSGRFKVIPGKIYTYTAISNIANPSVSWEIISGFIELVSTNGNKATFKFKSNFTSGQIQSKSSGGADRYCTYTLVITKL